MHVISQDFTGSGMKQKKHWNSFTTDFFVPVDTFISRLQADQHIHVCYYFS